MAERSKAPDSRIISFPWIRDWVFWSPNGGVGSNPTSDTLLEHFWPRQCKVMKTLCFTEALIVVAGRYSKIKRNCSKVGRSIYTFTDIIFSSETTLMRSIPCPGFPRSIPSVSATQLSPAFPCFPYHFSSFIFSIRLLCSAFLIHFRSFAFQSPHLLWCG